MHKPMMKRNLFNFSTKDFREINWPINAVVLLIMCVAFGIYDFYMDTGANLNAMISEALGNPSDYAHYFGGVDITTIMYCITAAVILYIAGVAFFSYTLIIKKSDEVERSKFKAILLSHLFTNAIDLIFSLAIFMIFGALLYLVTGNFMPLDELMDVASQQLSALFDRIPTLVELPHPLGFFAAILMVDFAQWVKHWLTHQSRFLWYVVHRVHHTPEIMHPFGIGPAFALEFILRLPIFILTLAATKLFAEQPLYIETLLVTLLGVLIEKFNHSTAFYNFAYRNKVVKFISMFYGGGVYHYTHHSAIEGEEVNNLSGMGFMFWDRVFGTFVEPREEKPPVGLTHQPEIVLNPFALYFSGLQKIIYELKHNEAKYWLKIIFGTMYFAPPNTHDTLILGYTKQLVKKAI